MTDAVYLHGFASSPRSKKANCLATRLREKGVDVTVPHLSPDSLRTLTLTSQLEIIHQTVAGRRVTLVGSSMGGYLAALYAARHVENVERLVLLAPAFGFARLWAAGLGAERMAAWQASGAMPQLNYGTGAMEQVGWCLMEDARRYEDEPAVVQPCVIYHGLHDAVVPVASSRAFARTHSCCELCELVSDHEMLDVVDEIWRGTEAFLFR